MFKFNFNEESNTNENIETNKNKKLWKPVKKHESIYDGNLPLDKHVKKFKSKGINLKYIQLDDDKFPFEQSATLSEVFQRETDRVQAVYEGGLQLWECTSDLLKYLHEQAVQFDEKSVLDLGCGLGLLGIYAWKRGASVTWQDYNEEVIDHVTKPNVSINERYTKKKSNIAFYSGDWNAFNDVLDEKFDLILTSETIYDPECYTKLMNVLTSRLNKNGIVYLAAKSYYFGIGGCTSDFLNLVKTEGIFSYEIVLCNKEGVRREIVILRFK